MQAPRSRAASMLGALLVVFAIVLLPVGGPSAGAIATPVPLGTAASFAVLAGSTVTNTGPTVVTGDVGVDPGSAVEGFPPGIVLPGGTIHADDAVAQQAQADVVIAYDDAAGQASDFDLTGIDPGGLTLIPGVYTASSSLGLSGVLTLDAQGNPDARWVFQVGSTLVTASGSSVLLVNGANACNVTWQVGSSATLGTTTSFVGNILALASITLTTDATLLGRALARTEAVTLDSNIVTAPDCALVTPTLTTAATATATVGGAIADTATIVGGAAPTGSLTFSLFGPADPTCTGTPIFRSDVPVDGDGDYASGPFTTSGVGDHRWVAAYSGDASNAPIAGACGDAAETSTVTAAAGPTPPGPTPTPTPPAGPPAPGAPSTGRPSIPRTGTGSGDLLLVGIGAVIAGFGFADCGRLRRSALPNRA